MAAAVVIEITFLIILFPVLFPPTHAQTKLFVSPVFVEAGTRKFFCPNIFFRVARRTLDALPTSRLTFRVPKVRPSQTQSRNTAPLIYLHASLFI